MIQVLVSTMYGMFKTWKYFPLRWKGATVNCEKNLPINLSKTVQYFSNCTQNIRCSFSGGSSCIVYEYTYRDILIKNGSCFSCAKLGIELNLQVN